MTTAGLSYARSVALSSNTCVVGLSAILSITATCRYLDVTGCLQYRFRCVRTKFGKEASFCSVLNSLITQKVYLEISVSILS